MSKFNLKRMSGAYAGWCSGLCQQYDCIVDKQNNLMEYFWSVMHGTTLEQVLAGNSSCSEASFITAAILKNWLAPGNNLANNGIRMFNIRTVEVKNQNSYATFSSLAKMF